MQAANRIYGRAGASLRGASWATNDEVAEIGAEGERRTEMLLNELPSRGLAILHDIEIVQGKYRGNVDHAVVSGSRLLLIDSKVWKPGVYWRVGPVTLRGWRRFAPAEKATMSWAADVLRRRVEAAGAQVTVLRPILAIWPSSQRGAVRTLLAGRADRSMLPARAAVRRAARLMTAPADERVVQALLPLLSVREEHARPGPAPAGPSPAVIGQLPVEHPAAAAVPEYTMMSLQPENDLPDLSMDVLGTPAEAALSPHALPPPPGVPPLPVPPLGTPVGEQIDDPFAVGPARAAEASRGDDPFAVPLRPPTGSAAGDEEDLF